MRRGRMEKEYRHKKALLLAEARSKRSSQEQLDLLDQRFGEGLGASKERSRLNALIKKEKNKTNSKRKSKKE